jgi:GNAT superfamily N-acetyltransferase
MSLALRPGMGGACGAGVQNDSRVRRVELADGGSAELRVLEVGDRESFEAFHAGLSPETRFSRYFTSRPSLPDPELDRVTHAEPGRRVGLGAWVDGELVGHALYAALSEPGEAEVAFEVADAHQGRGVGTALFEELAVAARRDGFRRFVAHVLLGNKRMLEVFRNLGFAERTTREGDVVRVEIDLDETRLHQAAARARALHAALAFREREEPPT